MLQFTAEQIEPFRHRARKDPGILRSLQQTVDVVEGNFRIPPSKAATWSGFYACPTHSTQLEFNIATPGNHRCPVDGEIITGEVYDGAWWRIVNDRNQKATHHAALLYLLTEEENYFSLARRYLKEYALVYPGYEVHGGIPYNNPGKANAQTLCDAEWIKGLLFAFDIVGDKLEPEEREQIANDLFRCCAEFLMEYRSNQIHNHEAVVNAAIAMIGLVLGEKRFLDFAVDAPYGLRYQLEHGLLADGLWFEGTPGYHFYALGQYMLFEALAHGTSYSFLTDPSFQQALKFPLHLLQPDGTLPPLNDAGFGFSGFAGTENIYELAWRETHDEDYLRLLRCVYTGRERNNLFSFFFGDEILPKSAPPEPSPYHGGEPGASGITTMFGPNDRFLLVKHSPFGGEHDHYDRLGIHFLGFGKKAIPDLGTCLYGAPMHYDYYKNTATHNTVCINGSNQPPANCKVYHYEAARERTLLDVGVDWDGSYVPMDSFVIPQWSEADYAGVSFRRFIAWYDAFFVDIFRVRAPSQRTIDYMLHIRGKREENWPVLAREGPWAEEGPSRFFHSVQEALPDKGSVVSEWDLGEDVRLQLHSFPQEGCQTFHLLGPDNPSVSDLSYFAQRRIATDALFVNVVSIYEGGRPAVAQATTEDLDGKPRLRIQCAGGRQVEVTCPFEK